MLVLKASVFAAAGKPEKGFSLVIRAASRAERAGLVPVLLEALAELGGILNKVAEFKAARDIAEAALPQVSNTMEQRRFAALRQTLMIP